MASSRWKGAGRASPEGAQYSAQALVQLQCSLDHTACSQFSSVRNSCTQHTVITCAPQRHVKHGHWEWRVGGGWQVGQVGLQAAQPFGAREQGPQARHRSLWGTGQLRVEGGSGSGQPFLVAGWLQGAELAGKDAVHGRRHNAGRQRHAPALHCSSHRPSPASQPAHLHSFWAAARIVVIDQRVSQDNLRKNARVQGCSYN